MFAEDDIERRRIEREAADRAYNEALTALDQALSDGCRNCRTRPWRTTRASCPASTNAGASSPPIRQLG